MHSHHTPRSAAISQSIQLHHNPHNHVSGGEWGKQGPIEACQAHVCQAFEASACTQRPEARALRRQPRASTPMDISSCMRSISMSSISVNHLHHPSSSIALHHHHHGHLSFGSPMPLKAHHHQASPNHGKCTAQQRPLAEPASPFPAAAAALATAPPSVSHSTSASTAQARTRRPPLLAPSSAAHKRPRSTARRRQACLHCLIAG